MATKRRKTNTALVLNPAGRSLSIGGSRRVNPSRKRRRSAGRRRNPVSLKQASSRRRNPVRKFNPISGITGLVTAAVFAGLGVSLFDVLTSRFSGSGWIRTGVKAGGAWASWQWGSKLPILGKYKNEIALVLLTSAAIDLMKLYVFPLVAGAAGSVGLLIPAAAVDAGDDSMSGVYGSSAIPYM